jgi:penicillin amidase
MIDVSDLVLLEPVDGDPERYRTPSGPLQPVRSIEVIEIRGADDDTLHVFETIWGPIVDRDHAGRRRVYRWVAHEVEAANFGLLDMEQARDLDAAIEAANRTYIPTLNCVVVDRFGRVGWTLMGPIPNRFGFEGRRPQSWADGTRGWNGMLAAEDYPRILDPADGRIWTANARVVEGEALSRVGDGGYVLGARAQRIRDGLRALDRVTPTDMLRLQLDDRAFFLERWRRLLLDTIASSASPLGSHVEDWGGRAAIESVGYRAVREFRDAVSTAVLEPLLRRCRDLEPRLRLWHLRHREGAVWRLLQEQPAHLLDPRYESWDALLTAAVDTTLARLLEAGPELDARTWGESNTTSIRHPLSLALPFLGRWLDMEPRPLPGDRDMPRVQSPTYGASQRMVVSPGREELGIFHMPCGQSAHPLSRFYRDGHADWEEGNPTPFRPGPAEHTLLLQPVP